MARVQVQQTAKHRNWNPIRLIGFAGMVGGLVTYLIASGNPGMQTVAGIVALASSPVWILGQIGSWQDRS